ncbi:hypothetical protein Ssi02_61620 [Sinosporangium siamense]|uniref:Uncharacterized protein n=1 Tax=Sinosporangium siamense TaxID=1367973 RepID=A0A919RLC1_9ACTN|nr:hypothetical protein Ssi02_61620 [Sinosporangium siamense]
MYASIVRTGGRRGRGDSPGRGATRTSPYDCAIGDPRPDDTGWRGIAAGTGLITIDCDKGNL